MVKPLEARPGSFYFKSSSKPCYTAVMGPKIYTPREAVGAIPDVEKIFAELDRIRTRLKVVKNKVDVLEMLWGEEIQGDENPDRREYTHYMEEIEQSRKDYEAANRRFSDLEAIVKSVDNGLVDFYGVIDQRLVFLCWKRGEKSVEYYHHLEDGFQGRQAIPAEELAR